LRVFQELNAGGFRTGFEAEHPPERKMPPEKAAYREVLVAKIGSGQRQNPLSILVTTGHQTARF
jgi:hypothetical protein